MEAVRERSAKFLGSIALQKCAAISWELTLWIATAGECQEGSSSGIVVNPMFGCGRGLFGLMPPGNSQPEQGTDHGASAARLDWASCLWKCCLHQKGLGAVNVVVARAFLNFPRDGASLRIVGDFDFGVNWCLGRLQIVQADLTRRVRSQRASKHVGDVFKCIWGVSCIEFNVEMGKTIIQSIRSKLFRILFLFARHSGGNAFAKHTHTHKTKIWP